AQGRQLARAADLAHQRPGLTPVPVHLGTQRPPPTSRRRGPLACGGRDQVPEHSALGSPGSPEPMRPNVVDAPAPRLPFHATWETVLPDSTPFHTWSASTPASSTDQPVSGSVAVTVTSAW